MCMMSLPLVYDIITYDKVQTLCTELGHYKHAFYRGPAVTVCSFFAIDVNCPTLTAALQKVVERKQDV